MSKNIFITGGYGFIGTNFVKYLLKNCDYNVIVFDKLTYASNLKNMENENIRFIKGDLYNKTAVENALKDIDYVVNFAAESHVDRSIINADDFLNSNIYGAYNILNYIKDNENIEKYIHISTDEVYGNAINTKFSENSCLNPNNPYSAFSTAVLLYKSPLINLMFSFSIFLRFDAYVNLSKTVIL